jgi:hypothetical protein
MPEGQVRQSESECMSYFMSLKIECVI